MKLMLYLELQDYFKVREKNNVKFTPTRTEPYTRDLPNVKIHLLIAGHFVMDECG